ncbi:uncharacterized protein LOC132280225 [Cornus florida]|uniref:uncharacterized protein LOC132280225 n=1 Tax=Cornus florida TaxID=4283 RepID=UPI002896CABD|nr:uncharacterized protein LOC132280225 [Cornus florida]
MPNGLSLPRTQGKSVIYPYVYIHTRYGNRLIEINISSLQRTAVLEITKNPHSRIPHGLPPKPASSTSPTTRPLVLRPTVILILECLLRRSEFRADTVIGARMSEIMTGWICSSKEEIVCDDDKPLFLSFMNELFQRKVPKTEEVGKKESSDYQGKYCPPIILYQICQFGIIDCAIAFLGGETGFIADLNIPFNDGLYPLHLAANSLSYEMIATLLCHGARTDAEP